jgi:hypothetical protein
LRPFLKGPSNKDSALTTLMPTTYDSGTNFLDLALSILIKLRN